MQVSLDSAYEYCRGVTRRRAKNFYYAFIALPHDQRKGIYATYAFCRLSDDYSDENLPLEDKTRLLQEYRLQLAQAFDGKPDGPVFTALLDTSRRFDIPKEYFDEIIDGVEMDLTTDRYQTFDDLYRYCYKVASVVGLVCIQIFGYRDLRARRYAVDMGIAMQLTNILRDLKEDCGRNRIYLPLDEMDRFHYRPEDLHAEVINKPFIEMMEFQVERARDYFSRSAALLPLLSLRSRVCPAVLRSLYLALLDRIQARGYDVFSSRVRLNTSEKLALTGKIWLQTLGRGLVGVR
ncbi:MAG: phytoene/squalene synthase family protein [Chloroflexi bacterium]|nr:phytoene/squalene synthase family protein [Chloroflexota bacterium]